MFRTAKIEPWYHVSAQRCEAITLYMEERCIFSAKYSDLEEKHYLCTIHAQMADFPVKPLQPSRIQIRKD